MTSVKTLIIDIINSEDFSHYSKILTALFILFILIYAIYWILKQSMKVWKKLSQIEKRAVNAETIIELENITEELKNVKTFHKSHYAEVDKIFSIVKIKMQYLKKQS